ncbi:cytochrome c oxidase subunit 6a, mitochondrial-like [Curcuma longa]|uniref:cytochrome c oxidase subunit 6a, mitochondrial-like n=1 Tax=Curcuma longa TaxID=136217 RepID=UPI003D9E6D14
MATSMARSGLRSTMLLFRRGVKAEAATKRSFSASAHDDTREAAKWEKITYAGIATCAVLAFYNLSKGHPHHEEPPAYSYLHIRNKEFPWGPDGLFEEKHHDH